MIQRFEQEENVISIGENKVIKGSVDENKTNKYFQLLSNIYSDAHSVILQELVANAHDSYKRINKQGLVTIQYENNKLHIKDKAEGISPYVFENYICKLGSSSKEQEVDSAGTMGIGSYSSWCVTDTFYLTTVYNNIKYYYSCYKADFEVPTFTLLHEEECDEENGTDYWFYIDSKDYYKFEYALKKLRYFENVEVIGFSFVNNYQLIKGDSFVINNCVPNPNTELEICFGNTPYPINWDKIGMNKITIPIALNIPLETSLMILPSREALGWNDYTIAKIQEKIIEFKQEFQNIYNQQYKPFDNILDYLKAVDNKNIIKIVNKEYNINSLNLDRTAIKYSKSNLPVPDINNVFLFYNQKWFSKNNHFRAYYPWESRYFSICETKLNVNKTKQLDSFIKCVLTKEPYFTFDCKLSQSLVNLFYPNFTEASLPEDYISKIEDFYNNVHLDLMSKYHHYDEIVVERKKTKKVKREDSIVLAKVNNDDIRYDYSLSDLESSKYLFVTDDKEEHKEILKYIENRFKFKNNKRFCTVVLCSKTYHKKFENVITLEDWFKTDMFKKLYYRTLRYNYLNKYTISDFLYTFLRNYKRVDFDFIQKERKSVLDNNYIYNKGLAIYGKVFENPYKLLDETYKDFVLWKNDWFRNNNYVVKTAYLKHKYKKQLIKLKNGKTNKV